MKKTTYLTFISYISLIFILALLVIINKVKPFQTLKIDFSYKPDVIKLIENISSKKLSFKEADYYKIIEEK